MGAERGLSREAIERLAHLGSWTWDADGTVTWSDELFRIFGFPVAATAPAPDDVFARIEEDDLARGIEVFDRVRTEGGTFVLEQRLTLPDGSRRATIVHGEAIGGPDGTPVRVEGTIQDVTEGRKVEAQLRERGLHLEQLALRDGLTGLANRTAFNDELRRAVESSRRWGVTVALVMVDLDGFKAVNDSLGHVVGDGVLRQSAARVVRAVRAGDFVARIGGDEFVVLMREVNDGAEAARVAHRLVELMRQPLTVDALEVTQTVSAGISVAERGAAPEVLIGEADAALYAAKASGRDRAEFFDDRLRARVSERLAIEDELGHAIERGELSLDYQPEIDLTDGVVVAVEALLRWRRGGEVIPATDFIAVAEESGLIAEIGAWAIREACKDAAGWDAMTPDGRAVVVRVNVSPGQLRDADLPRIVEGALAASGLDANRLCLEVTETASLQATATVRDNLERLRARGVRFAVDDFGAGEGSLLALTKLPVDLVKLDRTFVRELPDARHADVVAGVVAFAARLGVPVTAEGVERGEQATLLRDLGCRGGQGYLWSAAMHVDDVVGLLGEPHPAWVA